MKSEDEKNDVNNQNGSIQKESDELGEKQSQKVSSNENDVISNDQGNQNKEWEEFYRNEKNILRSGYQKGEGNEGDDVKFLVNPDGIEVNYFKKKKAKKINVDVGLSMTSQNIFSWNGIIADENLKTTLVVDNGNGAVFQKDVTGLSSFKFKPGDTRFDGVKCSIKLIIETKEGISIQGVREIKAKTTC
ncbi:MAG: hypothetical protein FJZ67_10025 [Bacteroidetes bacterium]|nr:hypothetical protein [Bacteroidota bacterium]